MYDSAVLFSILCLIPQFCLYPLALLGKKTMPNSLNSRRTLRMVHLEQVDLQKRFLMYPNEFCVSGCKQESRLIILLGLGILMGGLGTWDNPELLAVRVIEFFCVTYGIHLVLQFLNLNHKFLHCKIIFFLLCRKLITSQLSSSFSLCAVNSS